MSSRVSAVVAIAAPSDLRDFDNVYQELLAKGVVNKAFGDLIRPAFNFDPKLADSLSPVLQVTPDDAPTMLIHGDADQLVSIDNSHRILAPLQEKKVPCELVVLPGVGHGPTGEQMAKLIKSIDRAVDWFDKHLAPKATASATGDHYFDSNGVKIHYVVEGQGEPLILVHGFMASVALMKQQMPDVFSKMTQDYQIIAIDNRGHGQSDKPHDAKLYGVEMVNDVLRLMDRLKLKKAHIVGYSLGGFMTEYMLANHPDRMITATIGGMGWIKADDEPMTFIVGVADSLDSGQGVGPYVERMWPVGQPKPSREQLDSINQVLLDKLGNDAKALAACLRGIPGLAVTEEQLKANQVPALAIIGETDPLKTSVNNLKKVTPNLRVEVIEGADHGAAISSPKFVSDLTEFLKAHAKVAVIETK